MLRSRIGVVRLLLCGLALTWAGAASALSFTMAPVNFTVGSASGTITLVGGSQGAGPTGTTLSGTPGLTDDILIFQVVMSSGSVVEVGIGVPSPLTLSTGSGTIAGAGVDVVNGTLTTTGAFTRTFSFAGGSLSGTSDQFWVTFASVSDPSTVAFMVNDGSSQATVFGVVTLPEPSFLSLLALGVVGLAGRRFLRG
jgi:hypothetical protein